MIYKSQISIDKQIFDSNPPSDEYLRKQLWKEVGKWAEPILSVERKLSGSYRDERVVLETEFIFMPTSHWNEVQKMLKLVEGDLTVRGLNNLASIVSEIRSEIVNK